MDRMSIAWRGLRAVRNVLMLGALALCVYLVGGAQRPRVGYVAALAGVPVNRTAPAITGDHRLGGVLTCSRGTWDEPEGVAYPTTYQWVRDNADLTGQTDATTQSPRPTSATDCAATSARPATSGSTEAVERDASPARARRH